MSTAARTNLAYLAAFIVVFIGVGFAANASIEQAHRVTTVTVQCPNTEAR